MALLHLAADYARTFGCTLNAFSIDHGLRAESAQEASHVARWCAALNIPHRTLVWKGEKPSSGLQAAARAARYRLLCEAANSIGATAILTGHTRDDQAETVFMRLSRGSGPQGLSAMAPVSTIAGGAGAPVALMRPLLDESRADLTTFLHDRGQDFISDPSNDDPAYERVNVRALLAALEEQKILTQRALLASARRMRSTQQALSAVRHDTFRHSGGVFHRWGGASLCSSLLTASQGGLALQQLIFAVSGSARAPILESVQEAMAKLSKAMTASLGGALLERKQNRLWVYREPAALMGREGVAASPPIAAPVGSAVLWDQRFVIENKTSNSLMVTMLGESACDTAFDGPPRALASCPGVWREEALIAHGAGPGVKDLRMRSLAKERFFDAVHRF